ncbi:DUF3068 domain-containing protein [Corynebacterium alimapuense]|uniref:DUF3068 domain-containing protein n=1 Tax=Corynebacterium alimapuense TaxID=1576874 RepID=A0A3M8K773_9CORY|nr:DUF3068 domain-containing protein [Corynebacterium alimapuense]RNE49067.1 DUF3068 domain-containing protein [Corynebacterium alimapuense]
MLSKSRLLSLLLLGLGVALLAAGFAAPAFIHTDGRMPLDLEETTWTLVDDEAETRLITDPDGRVLNSPVSHQLHMDIQDPASDEEASLRMGSTFMRDSQQSDLDRLISAEVWSFSIDRLSGELTSSAVLTDQLASPVTEVSVDGSWLKFPAQAQQTTYEVFEPSLRETRPAEFVEELELDGQTVYRYRQEVEPTNVALLYASWDSTTTFADTAEGEDDRGYLFHSATRDFFVDQASGLVVEIREDVDDYYATADGEKREQVLLFEGRMAQEQIDAHVAQAAGTTDPGLSETLRWVMFSVGAMLTLLGMAGAFGVFDRRQPNRKATQSRR